MNNYHKKFNIEGNGTIVHVYQHPISFMVWNGLHNDDLLRKIAGFHKEEIVHMIELFILSLLSARDYAHMDIVSYMKIYIYKDNNGHFHCSSLLCVPINIKQLQFIKREFHKLKCLCHIFELYISLQFSDTI